LDIDTRLTRDVASATGFDPQFFTVPGLRHALALVAFTLLTLALAGVVLDRRATRAQSDNAGRRSCGDPIGRGAGRGHTVAR
jgi:hypothetical protein